MGIPSRLMVAGWHDSIFLQEMGSTLKVVPILDRDNANIGEENVKKLLLFYAPDPIPGRHLMNSAGLPAVNLG